MVDKLRKELRIVTNGYKYKIQGREKIFLFWSKWDGFVGDDRFDTQEEAEAEMIIRKNKFGPWETVSE